MKHDCGRSGDTRRLNQQLHTKKHETQCGDDLIVGNCQNVLRNLLNDWERECSRQLHSQTIRDGGRWRNGNALALYKRLSCVIRSVRLDGKTADARVGVLR